MDKDRTRLVNENPDEDSKNKKKGLKAGIAAGAAAVAGIAGGASAMYAADGPAKETTGNEPADAKQEENGNTDNTDTNDANENPQESTASKIEPPSKINTNHGGGTTGEDSSGKLNEGTHDGHPEESEPGETTTPNEPGETTGNNNDPAGGTNEPVEPDPTAGTSDPSIVNIVLGNDDSEIKILGVQTEVNEAGQTINVVAAGNDADKVLLVDINNDRIVDTMIHDDNGDGIVQINELTDVSDSNINIDDFIAHHPYGGSNPGLNVYFEEPPSGSNPETDPVLPISQDPSEVDPINETDPVQLVSQDPVEVDPFYGEDPIISLDEEYYQSPDETFLAENQNDEPYPGDFTDYVSDVDLTIDV